MQALRQISFAMIVLLLGASCGGSGYGSTSPTTTTNPGPGQVIATQYLTFNPNSITVSVGGTVSFVFQGVAHTVTFANVTGAPASIGATSNTTVQRTFSTAGTFGYQCSIHPSMTGTVVVQ